MKLITLQSRSYIIVSISYSSDGSRIILTYTDHKVLIFDASTGILLSKGNVNLYAKINYPPDSCNIINLDFITYGLPKTNFCKITTLIYLKILESSPVRLMSFSQDKNHVVSLSNDYKICLWDAYTCTLLCKLDERSRYIMWVSFSSNGHDLIMCGYTTVYIYRKLNVLNWGKRKNYATFLNTLKKWDQYSAIAKVFHSKDMQKEICSYI